MSILITKDKLFRNRTAYARYYAKQIRDNMFWTTPYFSFDSEDFPWCCGAFLIGNFGIGKSERGYSIDRKVCANFLGDYFSDIYSRGQKVYAITSSYQNDIRRLLTTHYKGRPLFKTLSRWTNPNHNSRLVTLEHTVR
jgi:hypothetical protein